MTCRELAEFLDDFLSGELADEQCRQIRDHLGLCPPCVQCMETYSLTIRLTTRLPLVPLPPDLEQRLRQVLKNG